MEPEQSNGSQMQVDGPEARDGGDEEEDFDLYEGIDAADHLIVSSASAAHPALAASPSGDACMPSSGLPPEESALASLGSPPLTCPLEKDEKEEDDLVVLGGDLNLSSSSKAAAPLPCRPSTAVGRGSSFEASTLKRRKFPGTGVAFTRIEVPLFLGPPPAIPDLVPDAEGSTTNSLVLLANLSLWQTDISIREAAVQFGRVRAVRIFSNALDGRSSGIALLQFVTSEDAARAVAQGLDQALKAKQQGQRQIRVIAVPAALVDELDACDSISWTRGGPIPDQLLRKLFQLAGQALPHRDPSALSASFFASLVSSHVELNEAPGARADAARGDPALVGLQQGAGDAPAHAGAEDRPGGLQSPGQSGNGQGKGSLDPLGAARSLSATEAPPGTGAPPRGSSLSGPQSPQLLPASASPSGSHGVGPGPLPRVPAPLSAPASSTSASFPSSFPSSPFIPPPPPPPQTPGAMASQQPPPPPPPADVASAPQPDILSHAAPAPAASQSQFGRSSPFHGTGSNFGASAPAQQAMGASAAHPSSFSSFPSAPAPPSIVVLTAPRGASQQPNQRPVSQETSYPASSTSFPSSFPSSSFPSYSASEEPQRAGGAAMLRPAPRAPAEWQGRRDDFAFFPSGQNEGGSTANRSSTFASHPQQHGDGSHASFASYPAASYSSFASHPYGGKQAQTYPHAVSAEGGDRYAGRSGAGDPGGSGSEADSRRDGKADSGPGFAAPVNRPVHAPAPQAQASLHRVQAPAAKVKRQRQF
ncbi:rna recognition motif. family protein, related [Neospora caninum Liverpool]|uniref:Rna recognition motif. family protein, related n=1 Tax=Neospora caninum (strain Liverpool) TaxID=572307 RepID=F0V9F5_NEOCL|nr:rna recognition motif. family protein, related [Neospora caninum Liverpool]CBZ50380.1 rna recognition motif. family protein, related [Neospora caninum Liverpool]|eukprot:XP_003880414.1 rna recognition motif. family protein, related [Neospora caninum Liverpool]